MDGAKNSTIRLPVIEHIHELQKRLLWVVLFVIGFGGAAYSINEKLLFYLQKPLGETLYFTSPTGGLTFLFKLCAVAGLIMALPIALYHLFAFLGPILSKRSKFTIIKYTAWSFILAYAGILFAYFVSLPAALHFLNQFGGENMQSLISANEYFSFTLAYLGGFAALFQIPLVILFINRIKPLKPSGMFKQQRFIILGSFIVAALLTPTPDPLNQLIMAAPAIVLYQLSILIVLIVNRKQPTDSPGPVVEAKLVHKKPLSQSVKTVSAPQITRPKPIHPARPIMDIIPRSPQLRPRSTITL